MMSHADVEKLRSMRAPRPAVLSLYLPVPLDPAGIRGLAAEAVDLMAGVGARGPDGVSTAGVSHADRQAVLDALAGGLKVQAPEMSASWNARADGGAARFRSVIDTEADPRPGPVTDARSW